MVRGATDLALGTLDVDGLSPKSAREHARLLTFVRTRDALGQIVCRRLAELPTTLVVSLDDRSGVMVMHGSPADEHRGLREDLEEDELGHLVGCVAEDVLVVGNTHRGFVRRVEAQGQRWTIVNAGSVGQSSVRGPDGVRTAHAVLVQPYSDGVVRAFPFDFPVVEKRGSQRARRVG
jgi:predicted phosphodiesterase